MKRTIGLAASLLALTLTPASGQPTPTAPTPEPAPQLQPPPSGHFQERLREIVKNASPTQNQEPALTRFSLDFRRGGSPAELVKAIEKATGEPLNTIINTEDEDTRLPPLKMNNVTVPQLFAALEMASRKTVPTMSSPYGPTTSQTISYGFSTADSPVSDNSIWSFHSNKPSLPPQNVCRFYSLAPYLDRGFTVDDITTAIQTAWIVAGERSPPVLQYHKETKMLIAFGKQHQLGIIDSVLQTLPSSNATRDEIRQLQTQVHELEKELSQVRASESRKTTPTAASSPANSPEEKSGK
jgi:hypothetical protein